MLTVEQLYNLFESEFCNCTTPEETSEKLAAMNSEYTDNLRAIFCDELLYGISIGYTKYNEADILYDDMVSLLCQNISALPDTYSYWYAVRAFFQGNHRECLKQINLSLKAAFNESTNTILDELYLVDAFFEPFKEGFPGFWSSLKEIITLYPHHASVPILCNTIDTYYSCKTTEDSLELLLNALIQCPDSVLLKELIGYTYYSMKRWSNAVAYFEQAEDDPLFFRHENLFFMMAWCYGKVKEHKLEEQYYRKTLESNPQDIDSLNNLGYSLYKQKRFLEAISIFEECLSLSPDYSYALNNYVRALIALGRYKDAKAFIKKEHKVSSDLKRRVEKLENTNNAKTQFSEKEVSLDDSSDHNAVPPQKTDLGIKRQQFSSEKILEDELTARIESGKEVFGLKLKVYRRKGQYGRQFTIPIGRLDLLCEDNDGNLYVIELKKDAGYDDAYQQTANYLDWLEQSPMSAGKQVYGIICLNTPTKELIQKVRSDKRMRLFEYSISYTEI